MPRPELEPLLSSEQPPRRRSVLGALAALPLAGDSLALAKPQTACPVAEAIAAHAEAHEAWQAAEAVLDAAVARFRAMPDLEVPPALLVREGDALLRIDDLRPGAEGVGEPHAPRVVARCRRRAPVLIEHYLGPDGVMLHRWVPWPEAQARDAEIVAAADELDAACAARETACGLTGAKADEEAAFERERVCREDVVATVATTTAGLLRKAHFVMAMFDGSHAELEGLMAKSATDVAAALSIVRDLVAMDGGA